MSTDAAGRSDTWNLFEHCGSGARSCAEAQALSGLADRMSDEFCQAVQMLLACRGSVIVTGMGKAGLVGQKITATLASTGTSAHFVHPAEAIHGDLGRIQRRDTVLALSMSGETAEVTRLIPSLAEPVGAAGGDHRQSAQALGRAAHVTLDLGPLKEACFLGWRPARARRRCWPWAMRWRWWSVATANSVAKISPAFIREAAWAASWRRSKTSCVRWPSAAWRIRRAPSARSGPRQSARAAHGSHHAAGCGRGPRRRVHR